MPHPKYPFLLSTREAARFLEVKQQRLHDLCATWKLHPIRMGNQLWFHVLDLMRYQAQGKPVDADHVQRALAAALGIRVKVLFQGRNGEAQHVTSLIEGAEPARTHEGGEHNAQ
jgi:hypothetical protein